VLALDGYRAGGYLAILYPEYTSNSGIIEGTRKDKPHVEG